MISHDKCIFEDVDHVCCVPATRVKSSSLRFLCSQTLAHKPVIVSSNNDCLTLCPCYSTCLCWIAVHHCMKTFIGFPGNLVDFWLLSEWYCAVWVWVVNVACVVVHICDGFKIASSLCTYGMDSKSWECCYIIQTQFIYFHVAGIHYACRELQIRTKGFPHETWGLWLCAVSYLFFVQDYGRYILCPKKFSAVFAGKPEAGASKCIHAKLDTRTAGPMSDSKWKWCLSCF